MKQHKCHCGKHTIYEAETPEEQVKVDRLNRILAAQQRRIMREQMWRTVQSLADQIDRDAMNFYAKAFP